MNYKVKLVADAKNDFTEAHMYYFKISPKVALKFKDEVKSAIEHLEKIHFMNYELKTLEQFHLKNSRILFFTK